MSLKLSQWARNAGSAFLFLALGCNSDLVDEDPPEAEEGCASVGDEGDSATAGEEEFEGLLLTCSGTRKARIRANVCANPVLTDTCTPKVAAENFELELLNFDPVDEEDLKIDEDFDALQFGFLTGACCTADAPESAILVTAEYDCAARACLDAAQNLNLLFTLSEAALEKAIADNDSDFKVNALTRARNSALHYALVLGDVDEFEQCTNQLIANKQYFMPDPVQVPDGPDVEGLGALRDVGIEDFSCALAECTPALEPGSTSIQRECSQNPNWYDGNFATTPDDVLGSAAPQSGTIEISGGGGGDNSYPVGPDSNASLSYRRYISELSPTIFVLTELSLDLTSDVEIGPLTFTTPHISLPRHAIGNEASGAIAFAEGAIELRIDASVSFAGQPLFGGTPLPFYSSSLDLALAERENGMIGITHARFGLFQGASAEITLDASLCDES